ncbi:PilZ domain-containing protein [Thioflexithrix psekupsensis]|nr:PilZ domain-containing protein [Thioflexithrix psekupsensis]
MMPRPGGMKRNMLTLHITDENTLYASYLPFLKQGGLFVPTEKSYRLGDEVFVLLTLMNDGEKTPVAGKVVWINPKGTVGNRPAGIGIHFGDVDKGMTREKIEKLLGAYNRSEKPTYTM